MPTENELDQKKRRARVALAVRRAALVAQQATAVPVPLPAVKVPEQVAPATREVAALLAAMAEPSISLDEMHKDVEARYGADFAGLEPGTNKFVLTVNPPPDSERWYESRVSHYVLGPDGNKTYYLCPQTYDDESSCPLCQAATALRALGTKEAKELAKDIGPRFRYVSNAFMVQGRSLRHVILEYPFKVFKAIAAAIDAEVDPEDIDTVTGRLNTPVIIGGRTPRIICVEKGGAGMNTTYDTTVTGKSMKLTDEQLLKVQSIRPTLGTVDEEALDLAAASLPMGGLDNAETYAAEQVDEFLGGVPEEVPEEETSAVGYPVSADEDDLPRCLGEYDIAEAEERQCDSCEVKVECVG